MADPPTDDRAFHRSDDRVAVLLRDRSAPLTVEPTSSLSAAVDQMLAQDYSQLPVIDAGRRPIGLLTQRDVMRTIRHGGRLAHGLTARDAMRAIKPASPILVRTTTEIWMALERLERHPAVLVTDGEGRLVGIVTAFDTSVWLQKRSADIVAVQDIELTLRDLINDAYHRDPDSDLEADIQRMLREMWDDRDGKQIRSAIGRYVQERLDGERCRSVLDALAQKSGPRDASLDDLTFAHYTRLLLSPVAWKRYAPHVGFEKAEFKDLLDQINETRNDLAHLRGVGGWADRDRLHWFRDWLTLSLVPLQKEGSGDLKTPMPPPDSADDTRGSEAAAEDPPAFEGDGPEGDGPDEGDLIEGEGSADAAAMLEPLANSLRQQKRSAGARVSMSFDQIDALLGGALPAEAREHRSWWSNASPHAEAWLEVGYSVVGFFVGDQTVRFAKDRARERLYLDFFKPLAVRLERIDGVELNPKAYSWQPFARVTAGCGKSFNLIAAFNRGRRFRLHAEIDVGDGDRNEEIFEQLETHRAEIEEKVGHALVWRRAEGNRVCQVSLYAPGEHHITDPPDELSQLADWVVEHIGRFAEVMRAYIAQA